MSVVGEDRTEELEHLLAESLLVLDGATGTMLQARLLTADDIGIELTEVMMVDPEASVSALVIHRPDAVYFSAAGATA